MKYIAMFFMFLLWAIVTIILTCTLVGIFVLMDQTDWFDFPKSLLSKL